MTTSRPTLDLWWTHVAETLAGVAPDETLRGAASLAAPEAADAHLPALLTEEAGDGVDLALGPVIGEGGMGVVHAARQRSLEREVAVKRTRKPSPRASRALIREARVMGSLEHPNLIPVHALGRDEEGQPVLVMKRVQGVSWRELLQAPDHPAWERRLSLTADPLVRHVHVLLEVCSAIAFAHARGVVHRDLKPDNVMIGEYGEVYVLDWGIAARIGEQEVEEQALIGTPAYLAPELLQRPVVAAPSLDVFLLGACLHEVLTGEPRHTGSTVPEVLRAAARCAPASYGDGIPRGLAQLCNRACALEPEGRPATVDAFREALAAWVRRAGADRLVETGLARLAHLEALVAHEGESEAVHGAVDGCRAALEQALREDPEHEQARGGLQRALEVGARHDLDRGDLGRAGLLVDELAAVGGDAAALRAELEAERRRAVRLRRLSRELDYTVSARQRTGAAVVIVGLVGLLATLSSIRFLLGLPTGPMLTVGYPLVLDVVVAAAVTVAWPSLRRNRVNRQAAGALVVMAGSWLVARMLAVLAGTELRSLLGADLVLAASWSLLLAVFGRPWLAAPAVPLLLGAVVTAVAPSPEQGFLPAVLLATAATGGAWWWSQRR